MRVKPFAKDAETWRASVLNPALRFRDNCGWLRVLLNPELLDFHPGAEFDWNAPLGDDLVMNLQDPDFHPELFEGLNRFDFDGFTMELMEALNERPGDHFYMSAGQIPRKDLLAHLMQKAREAWLSFDHHLLQERLREEGGVFAGVLLERMQHDTMEPIVDGEIQAYKGEPNVKVRLFFRYMAYGLQHFGSLELPLLETAMTSFYEGGWHAVATRLLDHAIHDISFLALAGRGELTMSGVLASLADPELALRDQGLPVSLVRDMALALGGAPIASRVTRDVQEALEALRRSPLADFGGAVGVDVPAAMEAICQNIPRVYVLEELGYYQIQLRAVQLQEEWEYLSFLTVSTTVVSFASWCLETARARLETLLEVREEDRLLFPGVSAGAGKPFGVIKFIDKIRNIMMHAVEHCNGGSEIAVDRAFFESVLELFQEIIGYIVGHENLVTYLSDGNGDALALPDGHYERLTLWLARMSALVGEGDAARDRFLALTGGKFKKSSTFSSFLNARKMLAELDGLPLPSRFGMNDAPPAEVDAALVQNLCEDAQVRRAMLRIPRVQQLVLEVPTVRAMPGIEAFLRHDHPAVCQGLLLKPEVQAVFASPGVKELADPRRFKLDGMLQALGEGLKSVREWARDKVRSRAGIFDLRVVLAGGPDDVVHAPRLVGLTDALFGYRSLRGHHTERAEFFMRRCEGMLDAVGARQTKQSLENYLGNRRHLLHPRPAELFDPLGAYKPKAERLGLLHDDYGRDPAGSFDRSPACLLQ